MTFYLSVFLFSPQVPQGPQGLQETESDNETETETESDTETQIKVDDYWYLNDYYKYLYLNQDLWQIHQSLSRSDLGNYQTIQEEIYSWNQSLLKERDQILCMTEKNFFS